MAASVADLDQFCLVFRTMDILSQPYLTTFTGATTSRSLLRTPSMETLHATETKYHSRIVTHRSSSVPEFCARSPGSNRAATPGSGRAAPAHTAATGPTIGPRRPLSRLAPRTDHHCLHQPSGDSRRRQLARPQ